MSDNYRDQFAPQPAVDVSPNWPRRPAPDPHPDAPAPVEAYQTSSGLTITECAVCLYLDQHDAGDWRRPYRAVTAVAGTPVCASHLVALDRENEHPYGRDGVIVRAATYVHAEVVTDDGLPPL